MIKHNLSRLSMVEKVVSQKLWARQRFSIKLGRPSTRIMIIRILLSIRIRKSHLEDLLSKEVKKEKTARTPWAWSISKKSKC